MTLPKILGPNTTYQRISFWNIREWFRSCVLLNYFGSGHTINDLHKNTYDNAHICIVMWYWQSTHERKTTSLCLYQWRYGNMYCYEIPIVRNESLQIPYLSISEYEITSQEHTRHDNINLNFLGCIYSIYLHNAIYHKKTTIWKQLIVNYAWRIIINAMHLRK